MRMIGLRILGAGLIGPGLDGWPAASLALRNGGTRYASGPTQIPAPGLLPANERRRTTACIKLALASAEQAVQEAGLDPAELASVFSSSHGDMQVCDHLCRALATDDKPVSPTQFHNSVHNAPAGYWSIAIGSRRPSTSLAVSDSSFTAGLLEAVLQSRTGGRPVLLACYDHPAPAPLDAAAPLTAPFAVALVVQADENGPLRLSLSDGAETRLTQTELEHLRLGNPAARALPLLAALADDLPATVLLPHLDRQMRIDLETA
jgi:hypothetical protein